MESSGFPIFNEYGDFAGYRGVDRDVTARKQQESTLLMSQFALDHALQQARR